MFLLLLRDLVITRCFFLGLDNRSLQLVGDYDCFLSFRNGKRLEMCGRVGGFGPILKLGAVVDFKEHRLPGQEFCTILMAMQCLIRICCISVVILSRHLGLEMKIVAQIVIGRLRRIIGLLAVTVLLTGVVSSAEGYRFSSTKSLMQGRVFLGYVHLVWIFYSSYLLPMPLL